jgi:hypothetical protein
MCYRAYHNMFRSMTLAISRSLKYQKQTQEFDMKHILNMTIYTV